MNISDPHILPLDFGVSDEEVMATALADYNYETVAELYGKGMAIADIADELQALVVALEEGESILNASSVAIAKRIHRSLAGQDLSSDPLTQNAVYQLCRFAMEAETDDTPAAAVVKQLALQSPKDLEPNRILTTLFEAALDDLEDTGKNSDLEAIQSYLDRFNILFTNADHNGGFAQYALARHEASVVSLDKTIALLQLMLHPGEDFSPIKQSFVVAHHGKPVARIALEILSGFVGKEVKSALWIATDSINHMADVGYDIKVMVSSAKTNAEYKMLTEELGLPRGYFDPAMLKPKLRDNLLGNDLGL